MRKKKVELEEKLLSRLLELQKALKEVSDLQEKMDSAQSEILSLRAQIDRGCSEKLSSSVSSEPSGVAWRVVTRMWRG